MHKSTTDYIRAIRSYVHQFRLKTALMSECVEFIKSKQAMQKQAKAKE